NEFDGDENLFVDDDGTGTAYLIYTVYGIVNGSASGPHQILVEKLSADYLSSTLQHSDNLNYPGEYDEATILFKRNGYYYALSGKAAFFGPDNCRVWMSSNPLSGWVYAGEINPNYNYGPGGIWGQETDVTEVNTANGVVYMWMNDLWQSTPDGLKGDDF